MSDKGLIDKAALDSVARCGRFGNDFGEPGVSLVERTGFSIANIIASKGKTGAVAEAVKSAFGIDLPMTPRRQDRNGVAFVWAGPEKWLALARSEGTRGEAVRGEGDFAKTLSSTLAGLAAVSDQSDGRCVIAISGSRARDVLAKGLPIDLHFCAFQPGDTALTRAAHVDLQIRQLDNRPSYEIAVLRSFGQSFWHWLTASAAEYGYEVLLRN